MIHVGGLFPTRPGALRANDPHGFFRVLQRELGVGEAIPPAHSKRAKIWSFSAPNRGSSPRSVFVIFAYIKSCYKPYDQPKQTTRHLLFAWVGGFPYTY